MTNITLTRKIYGPEYVIGTLTMGNFSCWTLEDKVRILGQKIAGQTAIPLGTYAVTIDMSIRFQCLMPHVLDVPGYDGIRIHKGNTEADTEGCILLGTYLDVTVDQLSLRVISSTVAFNKFYPLLQEALTQGPVQITITNTYEPIV